MSDEPDDPTAIEAGIAKNLSDSAVSLVDDAEGYLQDPTEENARDLITSMRIMRHRLDKAFREAGIEP